MNLGLFSKSAPALETLPIFPLNTVLFPGGILMLKIFEPRYMDMSKVCLRDNKPFGVCLIKEGNEVGAPAMPEETGCTAGITDWDMQQLGVLHLKTEGRQRFRILGRQVAKDGLISAEVAMLGAEPETPLASDLRQCATVLKLIMEKIGEEHFPAPAKLDDATWVGYRLAEVLPLKLAAKQKMLEINDSIVRLQVLHKFLVQQGLVA
ncbi:MAG TPA: LON peptidase substrate-binding domain-containing protein [Burkholderiales bacterium]|nr:LON peptidase substrate-binding domain-containing protein [Burkholderiales bacterium]